jgi:hypothetical protein
MRMREKMKIGARIGIATGLQVRIMVCIKNVKMRLRMGTRVRICLVVNMVPN